MSLQDSLNTLSTAVTGVGTTINTTKGSNRGVQRIGTTTPTPGTLPADCWGYTFESIGAVAALTTALPSKTVAKMGQRLSFFNSSTFTWTLTSDGSIVSNRGNSASLVMQPQETVTLEWDGSTYNAMAGSLVQGPSTTVSSSAPSGGKNGDIWYQV
jgi:hypothetical protein